MPEAPQAAAAVPAVLVVDDERQIVDLLTRYLAQHGLRACGAYGAAEARSLVAGDPWISVVISDVRMPGESGLLLAEELLRGRDEAVAVEIVLITGAGSGDPAIEAFSRRAFGVLRKPFRPSEVASVAARALAACSARREAAQARPVAARSGFAEAQGPLAAAPRSPLPEATVEELRIALLPILAAAEALAGSARLDAQDAKAMARRIGDGAQHLLAVIAAAGGDGPEPPRGDSLSAVC